MDKDVEQRLQALENRILSLEESRIDLEMMHTPSTYLIEHGYTHLTPIEKVTPEEKHIFNHSIKVDRGSFKLDQRIEALEKQRSTSKKKSKYD